MRTFDRLWGSGPKGFFVSVLIFAIAFSLESVVALPRITDSDALKYSTFWSLTAITVVILLWSVRSLPLSERGNKLIKSGAFKYFRHPLYAAFLTFFNFGLAVMLNNWIYIVWAFLQHPVWHWSVKSEERMMEQAFPSEYKEYCRNTGRFFPKFGKST